MKFVKKSGALLFSVLKLKKQELFLLQFSRRVVSYWTANEILENQFPNNVIYHARR